jgi:uncharacterized membrane protein YphA (DoxX/SURF4 family)
MNSILRPLWQRLSRGHRERQALALLRIVTGLFFLYFGLMKFNNPRMPAILALSVRTWAEHHPQPVYQAFLETVILPNAIFFTRLVTYSELFIGLSYITGALIRYSSVLGLFLNLNFLLATQHMGADALGINLAFLSIHATLGWSRSGACYGLDGWLNRNKVNGSVKASPKRVKAKSGKNALATPSRSAENTRTRSRKKAIAKATEQATIQAAVSKPAPKTVAPIVAESVSSPSPLSSPQEASLPSVMSSRIRDLRD